MIVDSIVSNILNNEFDPNSPALISKTNLIDSSSAQPDGSQGTWGTAYQIT